MWTCGCWYKEAYNIIHKYDNTTGGGHADTHIRYTHYTNYANKHISITWS